MKHTDLVKKKSKLSTSSRIKVPQGEFVLCIENKDYKMSLEKRKIYRRKKDKVAEAKGLLRVIDESNSDYLFPVALFAEVGLSERSRRLLKTN